MKNFKLWNTVGGWLVFAIAAATYLLTMEPTASFWDCGEFISSAYKLDVGHPPGAPFFMLMGHFFSLFASDTTHVAMCVNALSALASAFTILFLFWTVTALARKLITPDTLAKTVIVLAAGAVGALAYTFSDTFWFSAVEGEVYASSSLFTALVFWLILKWDEHADEEGSDKWLILIMYLMGLSIGVHLLNLLTIPAIVLVYYFRRYTFSWKGVIFAFLVSVAVLATILYGIIPGVPTVAGWCELFFVNTLGCPFNTGLFVYLILTAVLIVAGIIFTYRKLERQDEKDTSQLWRWCNTALIMLAVILVGYSSYAAIVIRSSADTPMDQNSPDNVFSLKYYLNREQYGDRPLLYGQTYNAPVELRIEGNMCIPVEKRGHAQYAPAPKEEGGKDHYAITGYKNSYKYMDKFCMLFPRMYSPQSNHVSAYKEWAQIKGRKVRYEYCGQWKAEYCPTFAENLRFFFRYQVNFMYWRYFMWNFSGRQNDLQGYGELHKGNWITGISPIDNLMLGDQNALPTELKQNKGHNVYYMLPLLLGIIGIVWQLCKKQKGAMNFTITFLLFFLTGLAIVVYLNQTPYQPRERDYAYAGSFYAFCIWIGLGVIGLYEAFEKITQKEGDKIAIAVVITLVTLLVPAQMASQNWDDHDRSDRYTCRDFGANYLKSCESQGIIFSNGDNDTFPLWYNQEVEGVGTDLRVCNLSYLQTDWYIDQMKRPYYESKGLPITWEYKDYMPGTNEVLWVEDNVGQPISVERAFRFVRSDDPQTKLRERDNDNYIPARQLYFDGPDGEQIMLKEAKRYTRSEMMVMEMLEQNNFERPVYFAVTVGDDYYLGLRPYFELTGLAYRVTPKKSEDGRARVNTEVMYDNMMHRFAFGNIDKPGIYIDENLMRMCHTHRMMFLELTEALYKERQYDKSIEVIDYAEKMLPAYNIPFDYTSACMAAIRYAASDKVQQQGLVEQADSVMAAVADNCVEYLRWSSALPKKQRKSVQSTVNQNLGILGYVLQNLNRYHRNDLFNLYYTEYDRYAQ
ncbi:MAG: DUF2723 domain-containing protein [Paludibacteraceae bacterium]|nr:DUF2723 domain-containing protein [Paludibacteraceae bacterium]